MNQVALPLPIYVKPVEASIAIGCEVTSPFTAQGEKEQEFTLGTDCDAGKVTVEGPHTL